MKLYIEPLIWHSAKDTPRPYANILMVCPPLYEHNNVGLCSGYYSPGFGYSAHAVVDYTPLPVVAWSYYDYDKLVEGIKEELSFDISKQFQRRAP